MIDVHGTIPTYDQHGHMYFTWGYIYTRRSPKMYEFYLQKSKTVLTDLYGMYSAEGIEVTPIYEWHEARKHQSTAIMTEPEDWDDNRDSADVRLKLVYELDRIRISASQAGKGIGFVVMGEKEDDFEPVVQWLRDHFPAEEESETGVPFQFMFCGEYGADSHDRNISTCEWAEIRDNYNDRVLPKLDELMNFKPDDSAAGKIGVLYGPPGTGKTHLIRSLSRKWRPWANFKYILDVERFFTDPSYMLDVVLKTDDDKKWNVILCEDAEEYIAPEAKDRIGQALARLLNIGDGLIGQGLRIILLFTTNAPDAKLHDAIVRPGRCFIRAHVPLLGAQQSAQWLAAHGREHHITEPTSLAELYMIINKENKQIVVEEETQPVGMFL